MDAHHDPSDPPGSEQPRLGIAFLPTMAPTALPGLARAAEAAGLDDLWVWEDSFKHAAIASAATALAVTERIRVGIGLMPAPLRNAALTAMELATLAGLHPGRLVAGIGHGVQSWMAQAGVRAASPLTLLREYAVALRALLAGETVTTTGRYVNLDGVALAWPPDPAPALMIGGEGVRTLDLAAELGDGILLSATRTRGEIRDAGRRAATRGLELVVTEITTAVPDAERLRREVAGWRPDAPTEVGVAGPAQAIARHYRSLLDAGASTVIAQPCAGEPDLAGLIAAVGDARRELLGEPSAS